VRLLRRQRHCRRTTVSNADVDAPLTLRSLLSTRRSLCAAYCASSLLAVITLAALSTLPKLIAYYLLLVLRAYLAVACPPLAALLYALTRNSPPHCSAISSAPKKDDHGRNSFNEARFFISKYKK